MAKEEAPISLVVTGIGSLSRDGGIDIHPTDNKFISQLEAGAADIADSLGTQARVYNTEGTVVSDITPLSREEQARLQASESAQRGRSFSVSNRKSGKNYEDIFGHSDSKFNTTNLDPKKKNLLM